MCTKRILGLLLLFIICLTFSSLVVQATTITLCNFNKDTYHQGETGYITVTIYNDRDDKIRITELTATIDYYYTDENLYLQKFYTNATLPVEIQRGKTSTLFIPFSLPTNIASGYTKVDVKAKTELWNSHAETWFGSEHPTYQPTLFIESPYKQQLDEQLAINKTNTTIMYLLGAMAIVFAALTVSLLVLNKRARVTTQLTG
jgi:hypothetical protein